MKTTLFGYCFMSAPEVRPCSSSILKALLPHNKQPKSDVMIVSAERGTRESVVHGHRKASGRLAPRGAQICSRRLLLSLQTLWIT